MQSDELYKSIKDSIFNKNYRQLKIYLQNEVAQNKMEDLLTLAVSSGDAKAIDILIYGGEEHPGKTSIGNAIYARDEEKIIKIIEQTQDKYTLKVALEWSCLSEECIDVFECAMFNLNKKNIKINLKYAMINTVLQGSERMVDLLFYLTTHHHDGIINELKGWRKSGFVENFDYFFERVKAEKNKKEMIEQLKQRDKRKINKI